MVKIEDKQMIFFFDINIKLIYLKNTQKIESNVQTNLFDRLLICKIKGTFSFCFNKFFWPFI